MGYPDYESERLVMQGNAKNLEVDTLEPVINAKQVLEMPTLMADQALSLKVRP
jgi:hypothetical protein